MKLNDHIFFYPEPGMLDCNTYVIKDDQIMLIDVGLDRNLPELIIKLEKDGISPADIRILANTHLHMDHSWANQQFKETYGCRIELAPVQKEYYDVGVRQTSEFFNMEPIDFEEDGMLDALVRLGKTEIEVIPTPGHSPDSVSFYIAQYKALICGDLIFDHNVGRADLPGGDWEQLKASIEKMSALDIEMLLPGHMGIVRGRQQVKDNFEFILDSIF